MDFSTWRDRNHSNNSFEVLQYAMDSNARKKDEESCKYRVEMSVENLSSGLWNDVQELVVS